MALEHYIEQNCAISESMLMTYVKRLRCACVPGVDGIMAEYIKWAANSKVISAICNMIGLCVKFGIVPGTFMTGLLIPLLKKTTLRTISAQELPPGCNIHDILQIDGNTHS